MINKTKQDRWKRSLAKERYHCPECRRVWEEIELFRRSGGCQNNFGYSECPSHCINP